MDPFNTDRMNDFCSTTVANRIGLGEIICFNDRIPIVLNSITNWRTTMRIEDIFLLFYSIILLLFSIILSKKINVFLFLY